MLDPASCSFFSLNRNHALPSALRRCNSAPVRRKFSNNHSALILVALFLPTACAPRGPLPTQQPQTQKPFTTMSVGVGEDYPYQSWSVEIFRRDMTVMDRANVKILRVALAWDRIEPSPGKYDWHFWDAAIAEAQSHGVELLPYICYTPKWNALTPDNYWRQPPKDIAAFANFVSIAANRYRGKVHSWELWNEPDNGDYWSGSVAQYAQLVRAGSAAVRQADPSARVVLGGISWNIAFLRQLLRDEHIGNCVDVINIHSYYETWIPDSLERLTDYVGRVRDLIHDYGQSQKIWVAEIGYSDFRNADDIAGADKSRFAYEHTPAYQAEDLFRALTLLRSTESVELATWYRINDLPASTCVIGDANNRHLGLVTDSGADKPALHALSDFVRLLTGRLRSADDRVWVTRLASSDLQLHCFQFPSGDILAVLWLKTDVPGLPFYSQDLRHETIELATAIKTSRVMEREIEETGWHALASRNFAAGSTVRIPNLSGGETRLVLFSK
jgi:hypothetical protein